MDLTIVYATAIGIMAVAAGFIYYLLRRNAYRMPQSPVEWLSFGLSVMAVVCAGLLLAVTYLVDAQLQGGTTAAPDYVQQAAVGQKAENFTFRLLESGDATSLDAYRGRVVVLNFWATWCAPCLEELPDLNRLQATYGDQGLAILTISDETPAVLEDFEGRIPMETVSGYLEDPESLPMPFLKMLEGRPESYVIDADGVIRQFAYGARDYTFFEKAVVPLLAPSRVQAGL